MFLNVIVNISWIILAYLVGSINFSIILSKFKHEKKDITKVGSGNAGATNAMRTYGFRFGLVVFILDTSKSFWLGFTMGLLQRNYEAFSGLIPQMVLLFVIIGHIFPIYFKFKGGKGAATLLGMIASISIFLAMIGAVLFIALVWYTKYVSLGSITIPYIIAALAFLCPFWNHIDTTIIYGAFWLNPICLFIGSAIVAARHWQNVIRLLNGTESKISFRKNDKDKSDGQIDNNSNNKSNLSSTSVIDQASNVNN